MDIRFLFVFLGAAAGGAVQSVAGFGGGVLMMLFLPSMFGLLHASAISASICIIDRVLDILPGIGVRVFQCALRDVLDEPEIIGCLIDL